MTLTLTMDWVILHTAGHQSWTSTYKPNFIEIKETLCGWMDVQTDGRTVPSSESSFVRSLLRAGVQPTLDPSAETFMAVQCASRGRGGELVGVCGVCASYVGWRKG